MGKIDLFKITDGAVYIKLSGEIDLFNIEQVKSRLENRLMQKKKVYFDVGQLSFIDSVGLNMLLDISREVEKYDGKLTLVNPKKHIQKLFETTGLEGKLNIVSNKDYNIDEEIYDLCEDTVKLEIPAKAIYIGVVRLMVSALASRYNYDIEAIEDIKVALTEVVTNSISHNDKIDDTISISIKYDCLESAMIFEVSDNGPGFRKDEIKNRAPEEVGGLGLYIVESLMDRVDINAEKGNGTHIRMIKYGEK